MLKEQLIKRILSLVNQINRKLKSFRQAGYGDIYEHEMDKVTVDINRKMDFTLPSGNFSKSKKKLEQLDARLLNKTMKNLEELNTHEYLQTVKTYQKYVLSPRLEKAYETMCLRYGEEDVNNLFGGRKPTEQELINYLESCSRVEIAEKNKSKPRKIETQKHEGDEDREREENEVKALSKRETAVRQLHERGKAMR